MATGYAFTTARRLSRSTRAHGTSRADHRPSSPSPTDAGQEGPVRFPGGCSSLAGAGSASTMRPLTTSGDPLAALPFIREAVAETRPGASMATVTTMDVRLSSAVAQPWLSTPCWSAASRPSPSCAPPCGAYGLCSATLLPKAGERAPSRWPWAHGVATCSRIATDARLTFVAARLALVAAVLFACYVLGARPGSNRWRSCAPRNPVREWTRARGQPHESATGGTRWGAAAPWGRPSPPTHWTRHGRLRSRATEDAVDPAATRVDPAATPADGGGIDAAPWSWP